MDMWNRVMKQILECNVCKYKCRDVCMQIGSLEDSSLLNFRVHNIQIKLCQVSFRCRKLYSLNRDTYLRMSLKPGSYF